MCWRNEEFVDHLLHCDVAYAIWIAFFMLRHLVDLFANWWTSSSRRMLQRGRLCLCAFYGVYEEK
jgi:hypothetical protein